MPAHRTRPVTPRRASRRRRNPGLGELQRLGDDHAVRRNGKYAPIGRALMVICRCRAQTNARDASFRRPVDWMSGLGT
jgi:hypothetical protein